jgi:dTDP-4-dehydrorhamnose reductase
VTVLVTGGTGQLGTAFRALLGDAVFPSRAELDLARPGSLASTLDAVGPRAIINCAAYTAVDRAESEEELATTVNGESVGVMAAWAADRAVPFVTYSTDYVFDGRGDRPYVESDPTDPVNAYGRSKLAGETAALEHPTSLVIRTSWVISGTHPNFVATMVRLVQERDLRVVDDQRGCPTIVDDLARATIAALGHGAAGLLHITNAGETTWFELARAAVAEAGFDPGLISACGTEDYPTPARRPAYSVLGSERREELGIPPMPHWRMSLPAVVAALTA